MSQKINARGKSSAYASTTIAPVPQVFPALIVQLLSVEQTGEYLKAWERTWLGVRAFGGSPHLIRFYIGWSF